MAPLPRSPILSALSRTQLKQSAIRQFRIQRYASTRTARPEQASMHWGSHFKRFGGTAAMYVPVVAVVMFWPVAVTPVMNAVNGV